MIDHRQRFEREARAVSSLNHPHICTLHDIGHQDGVAYLVMEMIEGETLASRLQKGSLAQAELLRYSTEIADALDKAHKNGIVHRDLKPGNVMLTKSGAKLLDFGLAKLRAEEKNIPEVSTLPTEQRDLTKEGMVLGTFQYMAPEQLEGREADARTDIFSFGAVMYEMATGKKAFEGKSQASLIAAILKENPKPISQIQPLTPPILERLVKTCLEKDPEDRWQNAHDISNQLRWISESSGSQLIPGSNQETARFKNKSNPLAWVVAAALALSLLAGAFWTWTTRNQERPTPISFSQLTFKRGNVMSARFAPDGQTVVYGAAFSGKPVELFSVRTDAIESRSMGVSADILGISKSGEMAILLNRRYVGSWITVGTLAKVSLSGGEPREILEGINDGDISDDGQNFAIVRQIKTSQRLEYPIGKVLFETHGYISNPVISPDGKQVAFLEHPVYADDRGFVTLYDHSGKVHRLSPEFSSVVALAWLPTGDELWFSGSPEGIDAAIWAVRPGAEVRLVYRAPAECHLEDINSNGNSLIVSGERRVEIAGLLAGDAQERDLSSFGDEEVGGISADGSVLAATQTVSAGLDYQVYFRRADASSPVLLGTGSALGITPDGKWILSSLPSGTHKYVTLFPVGPGESRQISLGKSSWDSGGDRLAFSWTTDGNRTAFIGYEKGQDLRGYMLDITNGNFRPITPAGVDSVVISPDGASVLGVKDEIAAIYPVSGDDSKPVPGWESTDSVIQWENTGKGIFIWDRSFPAKLYRLDLATGERELWKEMSPPDPIGVAYGRLLMTPDGKHYVYRYRRILNRLNFAEGLR